MSTGVAGGVSGVGAGVLRPAQALGGSGTETPQDTFMKLMIAQLKHQDPLKPQDSAQFLSQLAQFETATGIRSLEQTVAGYAASARDAQAVATAGLVGREVLVGAHTAVLGAGGSVSGAAELAAPTGALTVGVYDAAGTAVRTLRLGSAGAGVTRFVWDGRTDAGTPAPAGTYQFFAEAGDGAGATAVPVLLSGRVEAVSLPAGGATTLHLAGAGPVALSELRAVY